MSTAARKPPDVRLPDDLTELDQWVLWNAERRSRKEKWTKAPKDKMGHPASSTDPSTWCSYQEALDAWRGYPNDYTGIGFVFTEGDGFTGIDLDNCVDTAGFAKPWAQPIIAKFGDTYMEYSPSGDGIKIWAKARLQTTGTKRPYQDGAIEVYDRGRFFTTTGEVFNNAPLHVEEHQREVDELLRLITGSETPKPKANIPAQESITEGHRHEYLNSVAAQFGARGMKLDEVFAATQVINLSRCKPPKTEAEVRAICEWVANKERGKQKRVVEMPAAAPPIDECFNQARENIAPAGGEEWEKKLIRSDRGVVKALLANAITAIRSAADWGLAYDEFAVSTVTNGTPWERQRRAWTDADDVRAAEWLQRIGIHVSKDIAGQAVEAIALERRFHPVREFFDSLKWDGTCRLDGWPARYLGAKPSPYTAAVGKRWFISGVARIYRPGAKADCCLILESPQGMGKSKALKVIGGQWFTDEMADLGTKDSAMQTRGVLIVEFSELDSMSRSEVGKIKAFMSRGTDRFRPPYGRRLVELPRQCIFAGSVNHSAYLRDETGARRFWPVACGAIDVDALERDRDQLWAEAVARFRNDESWWLDTPELNKQAEEEQAARYEGDAWDALIHEWADARLAGGCDSVSVPEILSMCLEKKKDQWTRADEMRVARCLRSRHWERYRDRKRGMEWRYRLDVPIV